ncbi:MAG: hypothetical protein B7Y80_17475 [Hyphomicrobium sp. 32-62-53]|jgi:hypothetical protein|nr:MAG: hypothetical protein B7Z29_17330 [Hyphomicrobium sp. 12-62-95]OYX97944.1 MAG: hypothetical protein B7Y80_17475 [Hyphomicrobium sp. 32-62-53]
MNAPYRPTSQANLDHEIAQAIQSLRQQGQQNFAQDLEQVKQLSAALVSWNDALLQELDQAMSRYAQSRAQLLLRILTATPAVAASPEPPQDRAPSSVHHDPGRAPLARPSAPQSPAPQPQSRPQPQAAVAPFGRTPRVA